MTARGRFTLPRAHTGGDYRPDIDGLRAVAVLAVIASHLHLPFTAGGYVGVDVFFVISGYLITRNIWSELAAGTFSVRAFYLRRIRRIAPAFLVMAAVTLVVGALLMVPADLKDLGESTVAAALSASNIYFARTLDIGYFAESSEQLPMLHTWSLGVEEQFYLLWPAALLGLAVLTRNSRPAVLGAVAAVLVASFAIGEWLIPDQPKAAYFLLPARAGELMAGAILAVASRTPTRAELPIEGGAAVAPRWRPAGELLAVAGLGLIAFAISQFDAGTPFPGIAALAPSAGAAAVIVAGGLGSRIGRMLLGNPVMVFVGLISYSLYLWHWPVLAFLRYLFTSLEPVHVLVALPAMFGAAVLSYRFVEVPARTWRPRPRTEVTRLFVVPAGVLVAAGLVVVLTGGLKPLIEASPDVRAALDAATSKTQRALDFAYVCQVDRFEPDLLDQERCVVGAAQARAGGTQPTTLLWGDSHASAQIGVLGALAEREGTAYRNAAFGACPPVFGGEWGAATNRADCGRFRAQVERAIETGRFRRVIVGADWTKYSELSSGFRAAFEATVRSLTDRGVAVVLLGDPPRFEGYERECLARAVRVPLIDCRSRSLMADTGETAADGWLRDVATRSPGTAYLSVRNVICRAGRCDAFLDGEPLYYDPGHLSMDGSWRIGRLLAASADAGWRDAVAG